jgi:hypothetical protein
LWFPELLQFLDRLLLLSFILVLMSKVESRKVFISDFMTL